MVRRTTLRPFACGSVSATSVSVWFAAAIIVSCALPAAGQTIKATVVSTTLRTTSFSRWWRDLGYQGTEVYPLSLAPSGCPNVEVAISGVTVPAMLDTGTARGFMITNAAPPIPHTVEGGGKELNADGSHRGDSIRIRVETMSVLGRVFKNVAGSLSDWQLYSSAPFDGTLGLDFFLDRRLTLDYRSLKVGVTASALSKKLDQRRYLFLDLIEPPNSQGHVLYARAKVGQRDVIVYFDTGYNVSFIDPEFAEAFARIERPGKFRVFRENVPLDLGAHKFILNELRESPIRRGSGFDLPVALTLGSDFLSLSREEANSCTC